MANNRTPENPNEAVFMRGGQQVVYFRSPNLVAVRFRGGVFHNNAAARLSRAIDLPRARSLRLARTFTRERVQVFHCRADDRDHVMGALRSMDASKKRKARSIHYVSHVLSRAEHDVIPGAELGLDNRIYVRFHKPPSRKLIQKIERKKELRAVSRLSGFSRGVFFELTDAAFENPIKIANSLIKAKYCRDKIEVAEPMLMNTGEWRREPNVPGFSQQWHLKNTSSGNPSKRGDCNAIEAWDVTFGSPNVRIAIIDDGFELDHPDFQGASIVAPHDAFGADNDPSPTEGQGHGTCVAGLAVASRTSGFSVGVAPDCGFMPIRTGLTMSDSIVTEAFEHAFENKADVINCSWGPDDQDPGDHPLPSSVKDIIDKCVSQGGSSRKGAPVVFAGGNANSDISNDGYASYEKVIAVAATRRNDRRADYSDFGKNIFIAAPAGGGSELGVYTTDRTGRFGFSQDSSYTNGFEFTGTSAAAPLVSGAIGLMLAANPNLKERNIRQILKETAVQVDKTNGQYSPDPDGVPRSPLYGYGRLDAGAAVKRAADFP